MRRLRHPLLRGLLPLLLTALALVPGSASAAVGIREAMCGSGSGNTVEVPSLPTAQPGDFYVVTVAAQADTNDVIWEPLDVGWTWAGIGSANNGLLMASFVRWATTGEPASWTFEMGYGSGVAMTYAVHAFTGVDPTNPVVQTGEFNSPAPGTSDAFPTLTGTYDGMVHYLAGAAAANTSQSIGGGPTMHCNEQVTAASLATATEPVNAGATAPRTITRGASTDALLENLLLRPACSAGGITMTPPTTIGFPGRTLDGTNTSTSTSFDFGTDDQRASAAGWHVTLSATPFTNGSATLPADATTITSVSDAPAAGQCGAPSNTVTYPLTIPETAVKIYNATSLTGQGPSTMTADTDVAIPASARIGTYASTWTFTIASGP